MTATFPDYSLQIGDCRELLATLPDNCIDSCVTDPPYELGFMGKGWDKSGVANDPVLWREVLRVLKPGGYLLAFSGTRTYHRMACAIEDAGFGIRDQLGWMYGSGFPKSMDVAKAIEAIVLTGGSGPKNLRMRDMGGDYRPHELAGTPGYGSGRMSRGADTDRDYKNAPPVSLPEAAAFRGWGTALKPAWEPICMARKPLSEKTVVANVLAHGTGAINIDGCRIGTERREYKGGMGRFNAAAQAQGYRPFANGVPSQSTEIHVAEGRFPANLIHDGSDEVLALFPDSKGQQGDVRGTEPSRTGGEGTNCYGEYSGARPPAAKRGDSGSAARFFYCAKASKSDRHAGGADNKHPTVKPTDLMRYLCRLVTPTGGVVLDPFTGSGSTGRGALLEGFRFAGMEQDAAYAGIAEKRLKDAFAESGRDLL